MQNTDGWTPSHLASFLGNMDSLNLLTEHGADLAGKRHNHKMSCLDEIIRNDNAELLACVYPLYQDSPFIAKRNLKEVYFNFETEF